MLLNEIVSLSEFSKWVQMMKSHFAATKFQSAQPNRVLAYDGTGACVGAFDRTENAPSSNTFNTSPLTPTQYRSNI